MTFDRKFSSSPAVTINNCPNFQHGHFCTNWIINKGSVVCRKIDYRSASVFKLQNKLIYWDAHTKFQFVPSNFHRIASSVNINFSDVDWTIWWEKKSFCKCNINKKLDIYCDTALHHKGSFKMYVRHAGGGGGSLKSKLKWTGGEEGSLSVRSLC